MYCGSDWQPERSFVAWAHGLSDGPLARAAVWTAEHLCVFSNAGEGLVRQVMHNIRGHDGVYLLGQADRGALWYYYPLALTMKLSPALLALPLLLAVVRPRALANWACLAAAGLLVYTLNCRVQIGVRLVLPLVALGVAGLAGAVVRAAAEATPGRRRLLAGVAMVGVACTAWAAVVVWPDGLCYTNFLWGGTGRGYLCLSDSNYDWGQGLKELARWKQRHGDHDLDVWYFGTDPAIRDATFRHLPLHTLPVRGPEDVLARVHGHYLAVSTTLLYGGYGPASKNGPVENDHRRAATFLRACRPVDRTPTFLIFDFRGEQPQGARAPSAEVTTVH